MTHICATRLDNEKLAARIEQSHLNDCAKRFIGAAECTCGHADAEAALQSAGEARETYSFSLYELVKAASTIYVEKMEAAEVSFGQFITTPSGKDQLRLSCDDDTDYHFEDQQVELLDTGEVFAIDSPIDPEDEATTFRIQLTVERPICANDLIAKV
ncbi:hypothetical protein PSOLE_43400 [Pseudomonas oleovorans subsp. oleovorans]|uniref:Uncharacterized protein n=1 Tax=Ectopseudomonas oleovorans TaxID=301 RepID=A0A379PK96_ECTOL|nr:hypothetical protein [Pseudomonas oleovorans]OWK37199.1 hypothetical protein PSOLE_43400 [Pseudomonas oleovorans subsp. oleovorans]SEJ34732.1 hypothetical protein SAMN05216280_101936 [Pseudomonas oleovorans]SUE72349.1 Uncharacterised protein [Pseudomonas oleovorans]SUE72788.1 Uncharacterised protein [Pseudomonas oleovorans]